MSVSIERRAQGLFFSAATGRLLAAVRCAELAWLLGLELPGNARLVVEAGALVLRAALAGGAVGDARRERLVAALDACAAWIGARRAGAPPAVEATADHSDAILEGLALAARARAWTVSQDADGLAFEAPGAALRGARLRAQAQGGGARLEALLPPLALVPEAAARSALAWNAGFAFARLRLRDAQGCVFAVETACDEPDEEEIGVAVDALLLATASALRFAELVLDRAVAREVEVSLGCGGAVPSA